ncbi:DEP domain-containing mTOR-interacting protein isoform X1 [Patella vulgata]|uniref:DEP domain-containing mTOR-interacting protein isoform X1 n=1 Tax=Patella vulgata TaxID=6465 RepID=UPI00217F6061|nr:DEP domain-containing mTOR-interacting protein isoform X1 [Patella vulgata]XP_050402252.1 DEP domain-containing mTOR-interacting protein isoform X1 [Patella vulgata]XP_050402253.1 DEP domain-containing mTOR-interacting protein isoform X1 [Patella vulgata]
MQRIRTKSTSSTKPEIFLIGEQLRFEMGAQGLIGNRKYHLRTYKSCFVGQEVVDWLLKSRHIHSREAAVTAMRTLQENHIIHHVCDDHLFKDEKLFYRFRRDDNTYSIDRDLRSFYTGLRVYQKIRKRSDIMKDFNDSGRLYRDAFTGYNFVNWMMENEETYSRDQSVKEGRELLESEIIKHVTDDYHFRDGQYRYQFCLDFNQAYLLSDIFRLKRNNNRSYSSSSSSNKISAYSDITLVRPRQESITQSSSGSPDQHDSLQFSQSSESSETCSEPDSNGILEPKSVLVRQVSVSELEDPNAPYIRQKIKILSDGIGYGFVIRGDGPTYVQTLDPNGPAAAAGIKVRQYIYSVNGEKVINKNHKMVGKLIQEQDSLSLVVLSHYKER